MPVTSDISGFEHMDFSDLNESRIQRLMSGKKNEALYMGLWNRYRDLFREEKKADVLEAFWDLMHPENNASPAATGSCEALKGTLTAFQKLRILASESQRDRFNIRLTTETTERDGYGYFVNADFSIKGKSVRKMTYYPFRGCADLSGADLRGADLTHADLRRADLRGANLNGAILVHVDLSGADLSGARLSHVNLTDARLNGATCDGVTLTRENLYMSLMDTSSLSHPRTVESVRREAEPDGGDGHMNV